VSTFLGSRLAFLVVLAVVLALGIAIGIFLPGTWPFTRTGRIPPVTTVAPTASLSAKKIAEEWGLDPSDRIAASTVFAQDGLGEIELSPRTDIPGPDTTAFMLFCTSARFSDVWTRYWKKCANDGKLGTTAPAEPLKLSVSPAPSAQLPHAGVAAPASNPMAGDRGDNFMIHSTIGNNQLTIVSFKAHAFGKTGADNGPREGHLWYCNKEYVVHVAIQEVEADRDGHNKGSVNVRVLAVVR
jgi:hypothetical protein